MKNKFKLITLLTLTCTLQSCIYLFSAPLYKPKGKTANLTIDVDPTLEKSFVVLISDEKGNFIYDKKELLYGRYGYQSQIESHVKIDANKKLYMKVQYDAESINQYCELKASFTASPNKQYRLTAAVTQDKDQGFWSKKNDECYIQLSEVVNGDLVPVPLSAE